MPEDAALEAIKKARAVAERVEQQELRETLLAGLDTALFMNASHNVVEQAKLLVPHWRQLGQYATSTTCVRDLEVVLSGGPCPGYQGFRPKGK